MIRTINTKKKENNAWRKEKCFNVVTLISSIIIYCRTLLCCSRLGGEGGEGVELRREEGLMKEYVLSLKIILCVVSEWVSECVCWSMEPRHQTIHKTRWRRESKVKRVENRGEKRVENKGKKGRREEKWKWEKLNSRWNKIRRNRMIRKIKWN